MLLLASPASSGDVAWGGVDVADNIDGDDVKSAAAAALAAAAAACSRACNACMSRCLGLSELVALSMTRRHSAGMSLELICSEHHCAVRARRV